MANSLYIKTYSLQEDLPNIYNIHGPVPTYFLAEQFPEIVRKCRLNLKSANIAKLHYHYYSVLYSMRCVVS